MKNNRRLRVRFRFILFYSEHALTDPWYDMLQILLGREKYEEEMSDEQPLLENLLKIAAKFFRGLSYMRCR